jgi:hypothetical protein
MRVDGVQPLLLLLPLRLLLLLLLLLPLRLLLLLLRRLMLPLLSLPCCVSPVEPQRDPSAALEGMFNTGPEQRLTRR